MGAAETALAATALAETALVLRVNGESLPNFSHYSLRHPRGDLAVD